MSADFIAVRSGFNQNYADTFEINAYSVAMDSIPTNALSRYAVGNYNDAITGSINASIIHQVTLPVNQFTWSGRTKLDSVVLRLRLSSADNYFGISGQTRILKAYLINEDLYWDSSYYANRITKIKTPGIPIGTFTGTINLIDTLKFTLGTKQIKFPPHIGISMNSDFVNWIYGCQERGEFLDVNVFKKALKGIAIVDETNDASGNGTIFFVNPRSVYSGLYAYYDTLFAEFAINDKQEVVYNNYNHQNKLNNFLQNPFTGMHRDTGLLMPLGGSKLRIEFPEIAKKLANKNIVLNGASITFNVINGSDNLPYTLPLRLSLFASDSIGRNGFLRDQLFETESYFGGNLNSATKSYSFNITRYLQGIMLQYRQNKNINYGLNLQIPSDFPVSASRLLIDTRKNNNFKLKLNYTVIN